MQHGSDKLSATEDFNKAARSIFDVVRLEGLYFQ